MIKEIVNILEYRSHIDWHLNNCDNVDIFSKVNDSLKIFELLNIGILIEREINDQ